jgi:SAM-dependent methyltransferase
MTQDSSSAAAWSHGYDVSVGYTYGFGREMAPAWLELCARVAGWKPAEGSGRRRYLDLGCGQGMGVCLLAAACPDIDFVGIDFHPEHIDHANGLAAEAGLTNVRFQQADFLDLAERWPVELGAFDYVVMHGISSWVSPQVRAAIVSCLRSATRPGSLVYNSYNAQPGWLGTMPFQHITQRIKATSGKSGRAVIDDSVALFDRLRSGGADTFRILPGLRAQLDAVKGKNTAYLAGEYLSEHWHPFWHSEMAEELAEAGLSYAGPATVAEAMLPAMLPPPLRDTVLAQSDAGLREDVQDFVINQSFRRDIFCRDPWNGAGKSLEALADARLALAERPAGNALTIKAAFGEISLQPQAYAEIVAALENGPQTVRELAALPGLRAQGLGNVTQIVLLLLHAGALAPAVATASTEAAHRLNAVIARRAVEGMPYEFLAAPAIGSAIAATPQHMQALASNAVDGDVAARWRALGVIA